LFDGQFDLPSLQTLLLTGSCAVMFGPDSILRHPPPQLATLDFEMPTAEAVDALRDTGLCEQLEVLRLCVDEPVLDEVVRDARAFAHLHLVLTGGVDTEAERADILARLRAVIPRTFDAMSLADEWLRFRDWRDDPMQLAIAKHCRRRSELPFEDVEPIPFSFSFADFGAD
jgi:hypothetical protein